MYHLHQKSEGTTLGGAPSVCCRPHLDSWCMSSTCGCFELWQRACVEWVELWSPECMVIVWL